MNTRGQTVRLATRGSALALRQAGRVREQLESRRYSVELVEVETTGDQLRDELIHRLGKTGAFVRSLDEQVLDGEVEAAVHSMKDMPTERPDSLVVAGVPERGAPNDVLVTPDGTTLEELPEGATVGTSSLRRRAQLLSERPDLDVAPLRGNVDTRIEKLLAPTLQREHERRVEAERDENAETAEQDSDESGDDGDETEDGEFEQSVEEWFDSLAEIERRALEREVETEFDAVVLAESGLDRAGLLHHLDYQRLAPERFVPAAGQGALAVTAVDGDLAVDLVEVLDHPPTRVETTVERTVLGELGGGCVAPIGVYAVLQGSVVKTTVRVLSRDGTEEVSATRDLPVERHVEAARDFAADLAERGADGLVAAAKRESTDDAKRANGEDDE
ncbi:MAG: hydroxymethylbilane synthase [Haloarculaceae archaeon]